MRYAPEWRPKFRTPGPASLRRGRVIEMWSACGNGAETSVRNAGSNISLEEFGMDMHGDKSPPFWKSRCAIALLGFGVIAIFFMLSEHRAHFLGVLPFV